jgi:CheY-like chemotaxis protein
VRLEHKTVPATRVSPLPLFATHRILVALANATERQALAHALKRLGADVCEAATGPEAIEQLGALGDNGPLPCLIADAQLPAVGGYELATLARAKPAFSQAAIIVLEPRRLSTRTDPAVPAGVLRLHKPVRFQVLRRELHRLWTGKAENAISRAEMPATHDDVSSLPNPDAGSCWETRTALPARVLIAEDHPANQKLAQRMIEKLGYHADVVGNGREAVDAISRQDYDLVLMDYRMPVMSGLEATVEIRRREKDSGRHLPIIALTANAMNEDRDRCAHAGMNDFLSKPVRIVDLRDTVKKWLKRPGQSIERSVATPISA